MFWAVIGVALSAVGIIGLYWQIHLTRKAVEDTGEATEAMRESNEIAKETRDLELRAYVTVEPGGVNEAEGGHVRVPVIVENVGQTPAHGVMLFSRFGIVENPRDFDPTTLAGWDSMLSGQRADATFGRSIRRYIYPYIREAFVAEHMAKIAKKEKAIVHYGYVIYEDVFGKTHRTHFAFYHWGEHLTPESSLRCPFGNSAD